MSHLEGDLTWDRIAELSKTLERLSEGDGPVRLDLSRVTGADSAGVALLVSFAKSLKAQRRTVTVANVPREVEKTLELFPWTERNAVEPKVRSSLAELAGSLAADVYTLCLQYLVLAADTAYFLVTGLFRRRGIRWSEVAKEMYSMGSSALGVVGLIAFLVGGTMALQSAAQLRQFGANIFVVDLISISMTRELGPLMAAIVVAGRSGSAVAAEIGTMVITEEIDALKTMGLHPTRFLIVPKVLAISFTQPMLTIYANLLGIFGGFLVAVMYLEVGPSAFFARLSQAMFLKDLVTGLVKSVVFAQLIVTVGAICGLRTKGGADAVGRSTTMSVVAGIFCVIVADAIASLVFYFGD